MASTVDSIEGAGEVLLRVDPSLDRQFGRDGVWLFWRTLPGGERVAMVTIVASCGNRECPCRIAQLSIYPSPPELFAVTHTGTKVQCCYPDHVDPSKLSAEWSPVELAVDINTGAIDAAPETDAALIDWLSAQVDGPLLDELHRLWRAAKGFERRTTFVAGPWMRRPPGTMVRHVDPFPDERGDVYLIDNLPYLAEDYHCTEPTCPCTDVRLYFRDASAEGRGDDIGSLVYAVGSGKVTETEVAPGQSAQLLDRLWQAFTRRHALPAHLERRRQQMKEVGLSLKRDSSKREDRKVGRNDPCPCGSGKKYKRCCLSEA